MNQLDKNQLTPKLRDFVTDYLEVNFQHIPIEISLLNCLVHFSRLICTRRVEVESLLIRGSSRSTPCNLYAMILAKSGGYKDVTYRSTEYVILGGAMDLIQEEYTEKRAEYIKKLIQEAKDLGLDKKEANQYITIRTPKDFIKDISKSTFEGFNSTMYSNYVVGVGCTFFRHSEFADILLSTNSDDESLLLSLKEAFDGRVHNKIIKSENMSYDIEKVPTIALVYSVFDNLVDGDGKISIDDSFSGGMARRFLMSFIPRKVEPVVETLDDAERIRMVEDRIIKKYRTTFNDMKKISTNLVCTREADELLLKYKNDCNQKAFDIDTDDILSDQVGGRFWIALKLSGIISAFERSVGKREVTSEQMATAIYLVEYFGDQFALFRRLKPRLEWERLLEVFKANMGVAMRRTDVMKSLDISHHNFKQWFDENFELLEEYLLGSEYILTTEIVGNNNKPAYKLIRRSDIEKIRTRPISYSLDNFQISRSDNMQDNPWEARGRTFERATVSLSTFVDTVSETAIMPCLLEGGKKAENVVPGGVLMGIDIDDNMTLLEAEKFFKDNHIRALIITSASHQRAEKKQTNRDISDNKEPKKIEPKDKFHVFAFLDSPWSGTPEQWKTMYQNVIGEIGNADEACSNINRMFFRSPEDAVIIRIDGDGIDWKSYLEIKERKPMMVRTDMDVSVIKSFTYEQNVDYYTKTELGLLLVSEGQSARGKNGKGISGRNTYLNNIWKAQFDAGGVARAELAVRYANDVYCNPAYPEKEIVEFLKDKK